MARRSKEQAAPEPQPEETENYEREAQPGTDVTVLQAISKAELDQQITTARAFPRSLRRFLAECMDMATLNERVASECIYAIPRAGKTISGPSARLAEIVASAWGNCQAGARIVDEGPEFVTAQGIFRDLERNVSITYEVRRRITDKNGNRFNADMIGVTGAAASSIALRNAVFRGVPKAFWSDIYEAARKAAVGDVKTIVAKRGEALDTLQKMGVPNAQVFEALGIKGIQDIGTDELVTLKGLVTAIKDGETTIEAAFAVKAPTGKANTAAPKATVVKDNTESTTSKAAEAVPAAPLVATPEGEQAQPTGGFATAGIIEVLRARLEKFSVATSRFLAEFEIGAMEELPFDQIDEAYDWISRADAP